jgi:hypothetical protein
MADSCSPSRSPNTRARLAAILLGALFLACVVTVPNAGHDPNQWPSAFIALAMCGGSWISARALSTGHRDDVKPGVGLPFAWYGLATRGAPDA